MANPIVIVGAGLSGLAAAHELEAAGETCLILEGQSHLGGKLETTIFDDAYILDRGFQVLLPAYPELRRFTDLESSVELKYFKSGARLEMDDGPILMANPLRHPQNILSTALGTYATLKDKLLVVKLMLELQVKNPEMLLSSASGSTLDHLQSFGFSEKMIENFWRPFFSGIFLEPNLATAAGYFRYLTHIFAASPVAVPRLGIGELPKFLAKKLRNTEIRLSTSVENINGFNLELASGAKISARAVLTDTEGHANAHDPGPFGMVTSYWFKAPEPPFEGAWLSLNSRSREKRGSINHVAVMSNVSADYAARGDALICVSVVGPRVNLDTLLAEATPLYGENVKSWKLLRVDEIARPFPLYINRTDSDTPSQQGALARGRRAARSLLEQLS